jgi:hypothetical protein
LAQFPGAQRSRQPQCLNCSSLEPHVSGNRAVVDEGDIRSLG